jgi:hypothetical protein
MGIMWTRSFGFAQCIELTVEVSQQSRHSQNSPKNRLAYFALQNKTNYNMGANTCTYNNIFSC